MHWLIIFFHMKSTLPLTSALDGVSGQQHHAPAALPAVKGPQFPLYRSLSGPPQDKPGRLWKILSSTGLRNPQLPARRKSVYLLTYDGPWHFAKVISNDDLKAFMRASPTQFCCMFMKSKNVSNKSCSEKKTYTLTLFPVHFCARLRVFEIINPLKTKRRLL